MLKQLFEFVGSIPDRQTVYIIEIVLFIVCLLSTFLGRVIMSGSGKVLNKVYGKTNYFFAAIKYILTAIGFLLFVFLLIFWLVDFIIHFFDMGLFGPLRSVIFALIAIIVWVIVFVIGDDKEIEKEIEIEHKNMQEIDSILDSNPIFSAAMNIVTEHSDIKTVRVYNNGIAFYKNDIPIPPKNEPYIWGTSNSEVSGKIRAILKEWLNEEGDVNKSNGDIIIKYEDFDFSDASIRSMEDIAKHLTRRLSPRFSFGYAKNEWTIKYNDTFSYSTGYNYFNGRITESVSREEINVTESATAYFSLNPPEIDVYQFSEKVNSKRNPKNYW